jgi:beta-N-acetylhexosaminidase
VIEICKDPSLVLRAYEALLAEAERSSAFRRRIEATARRVLAMKRRKLSPVRPRVATASAIAKLRGEVQRFAEEVTA